MHPLAAALAIYLPPLEQGHAPLLCGENANGLRQILTLAVAVVMYSPRLTYTGSINLQIAKFNTFLEEMK